MRAAGDLPESTSSSRSYPKPGDGLRSTKPCCGWGSPFSSGLPPWAKMSTNSARGAFGVAILAAVFAGAGGYTSAAAFSAGFAPAIAAAAGHCPVI